MLARAFAASMAASAALLAGCAAPAVGHYAEVEDFLAGCLGGRR